MAMEGHARQPRRTRSGNSTTMTGTHAALQRIKCASAIGLAVLGGMLMSDRALANDESATGMPLFLPTGKHPYQLFRSLEIQGRTHREASRSVAGVITVARNHDKGGFTASIITTALTAGRAYSLLWMVFEQPAECADPYVCTRADLAPQNPRAGGKLVWAGEVTADEEGALRLIVELGERHATTAYAMARPVLREH